MLTYDKITLEGANLTSKENEDGTFEVIVGAYNVFNSTGEYYVLTDKVRKLFNDMSLLNNRLSSSEVKAEENHPSISDSPDPAAYIDRFKYIDDNNTCGTFKTIKLDERPTKVAMQDEPVYLIRALILPEGPKSKELRDDLLDPNVDVAFSLRGFSNRHMVGNIKYKESYLIVTYDKVKRPGVGIARQSQWLDFDIESEEYILTDEDKMNMLTKIETMEKADIESDELKMLLPLKSALTGCDDNSCIYKSW